MASSSSTCQQEVKIQQQQPNVHRQSHAERQQLQIFPPEFDPKCF
jgi:hypothetical protein